jgi:hypothetical protein
MTVIVSPAESVSDSQMPSLRGYRYKKGEFAMKAQKRAGGRVDGASIVDLSSCLIPLGDSATYKIYFRIMGHF